MRSRARGHTLLEITVSTVILSLLILAAATASKIAIVATADVALTDHSAGEERRTLDTIGQQLLSASRATLQGTPSVQGVTAENLQAGVSYQDLRFRKVIGFRNGAVTYEPATGQTAAQLARTVDRLGRGSLVLINHGATTTLLDDVRSVAFQLAGAKLTVTLVLGNATAGDSTTGTTTRVLDFVLRVP